MNTNTLLEKALQIAAEAHDGQADNRRPIRPSKWFSITLPLWLWCVAISPLFLDSTDSSS